MSVDDWGRPSTPDSQDNDTKRTSGQELLDPRLNSTQRNVEARRNDTALVDSSEQLNDDLAGSVVVNLLELANVAWKKKDT